MRGHEFLIITKNSDYIKAGTKFCCEHSADFGCYLPIRVDYVCHHPSVYNIFAGEALERFERENKDGQLEARLKEQEYKDLIAKSAEKKSPTTNT